MLWAQTRPIRWKIIRFCGIYLLSILIWSGQIIIWKWDHVFIVWCQQSLLSGEKGNIFYSVVFKIGFGDIASVLGHQWDWGPPSSPPLILGRPHRAEVKPRASPKQGLSSTIWNSLYISIWGADELDQWVPAPFGVKYCLLYGGKRTPHWNCTPLEHFAGKSQTFTFL